MPTRLRFSAWSTGLLAATRGAVVQEEGLASGEGAISQVVAHDLHRAELVSLPITLLILVLAFGALVARCCRCCSA